MRRFLLTANPLFCDITCMGNTKTFTDADLLAMLRKRTEGRTQLDVAISLGFTAQFINDVLKERRPITRTLAETLGFVKLENRYRKQAAK